MIDEMYFRVAKIQTAAGGQTLTNATGFFFLQDRFLYLVTSRHVVINEVASHHPDRLTVSLHASNEDLRQRHELSIPLYVDGVPQWWQHANTAADVVAVAVNDPQVLSSHFVRTFDGKDILEPAAPLPLGQVVLIPGFPLGFHDTLNNLPIVRSATIASSFAHPFKGQPYFLTDARLHRGMSGSPVIALVSTPAGPPAWRLLGIHSSALDVSDRDPAQDERLALNTAWYASLIPDLLPRRSEPARHAATIA